MHPSPFGNEWDIYFVILSPLAHFQNVHVAALNDKRGILVLIFVFVLSQDAHNCITEFDKDTAMFAVYDGHGGKIVIFYYF